MVLRTYEQMERRSFAVGRFVSRFRRCLKLYISRVLRSPSRWGWVADRVLAPSKRDGAGSSRMSVAHHGEGSVFRSMLGLGEPLGIAMKALPTALEGARAV